MKIGLCAIVKEENLYLREWVEYHLNLGFDKIFIYDNNNIDGEYPNTVIQDYVDNGNVNIIYDFRGKGLGRDYLSNQTNAYNKCLDDNQDFDWILFIDIDEFLCIEKYNDIHYVFNEIPMFNDFDAISISSYWMGDKDALYYENKPVRERFKQHLTGIDDSVIEVNTIIKSWIKPTSNARFYEGFPHCPESDNVHATNGNKIYGKEIIALHNSIYDVMWYEHYYTKSLTEHLSRAFMNNRNIIQYGFYETEIFDCKIKLYKTLNGWSDEKETIYQNFLKQHMI